VGVSSSFLQPLQAVQPKRVKMLDGFMLLYSCRVKLPQEAVKSKLPSLHINDVVEDDLLYFTNLVHLDISDNEIQTMEQLENLKKLRELNLSSNNITSLHLKENTFKDLELLDLSYNRIPSSHLNTLAFLNKLRVLNLESNDLTTLPSNLSFLSSLLTLNLSNNNFTSDNLIVEP
jgi:Leucine-rich repeat (LRR) protein